MRSMVTIYEDILHMYYNGYVKSLPGQLQKKFIRKTLTGKWIQIIVYTISYFKKWLFGSMELRNHLVNRKKIVGKIWVFAETRNQYNALMPLAERLQNVVWVGLYRDFDSLGFIYLVGLKRVWMWFGFVKTYKKLKKNNEQKAKEYKEAVYEMTGLYEYCVFLLKKYKPSKVIVSNDHSFFTRSLMHAARHLSIDTVYIQHASVSGYFPPLLASLNLLEGNHALETYEKAGIIRGVVKLIGMPKFDDYVKFRKFDKEIKIVGIALNPADNVGVIHDLVSKIIIANSSIKFVYRKHPMDRRDLKFTDDSNLFESNSQKESAFKFLTKVDLLIGGDSSIHLEATLLNIPCVYYCFSGLKSMKDYYGFIKNGMIQDAGTVEDVCSFIKKNEIEKEPVFEKAKYYNELVGTVMEGKSINLAVECISQM